MKKILLCAVAVMAAAVLCACSSDQAFRDFNERIIEQAEQVAESGENRILFLGSSTFQGLTTQQIGLYCIQNGEWAEIAMDEVHLQEEDLCEMVDNDMLAILPGGNGEVSAGEPVVYSWDMKNGQFVKTF